MQTVIIDSTQRKNGCHPQGTLCIFETGVGAGACVGGCLQVARGGKMRRDVTSSAKFVTRFMVWRGGGSVCVQIIYTGLSEVAVGFDD